MENGTNGLNYTFSILQVTFKSSVIPLTDEVLEYLMDNERLVLPKECDSDNYDGKEDDYEEFGDVDWSTVEEGETAEQKSFPEFSAKVAQEMKALGGEVFPKLNWSCPKDASWVGMGGSLKCTSLSQLYLLLKSSDFVAHDLTMPFSDCDDQSPDAQSAVQYCLVLRKWREVNPGTEWRCFVKDGRLVAACQRDTASHYSHMAREEESIRRDLVTFFREQIRDKFPLSSYVFDVTRPGKDRVILMDFNPFGNPTDTLLFESWEDLNEIQVISFYSKPSSHGYSVSDE